MKIMGKTTSKKPYVGAISSDAFYVGESKTYGLEKVDLIVAYALENGIDLVTASREFGMTDEKKYYGIDEMSGDMGYLTTIIVKEGDENTHV